MSASAQNYLADRKYSDAKSTLVPEVKHSREANKEKSGTDTMEEPLLGQNEQLTTMNLNAIHRLDSTDPG